jgi:hypothetical protein
MTVSDDPTQIVLVEFGELTDEQLLTIDLHHLRALGADQTPPAGSGYVAAFWLRDGEDPSELYDEVRGWAIGRALPIRRRVTD